MFQYSLIISLVALTISILGFRFQIISMINKQLSEMAQICNSNIDSKSDNNTQALIRTTQNISLLISTIIVTKQLLDNHYKNYKFFLLYIGKQSCLDLFYLQLHSSIKDYLFLHKIPDKIDNVFQGTDDNLKAKIREQIILSHNILKVSNKKFKF